MACKVKGIAKAAHKTNVLFAVFFFQKKKEEKVKEERRRECHVDRSSFHVFILCARVHTDLHGG